MKLVVSPEAMRMAHFFQYPQPRVYAMKRYFPRMCHGCCHVFQYPQPRVYAMKRIFEEGTALTEQAFSTLNLGSTR